jgi:BlaI family penicillinase repressor
VSEPTQASLSPLERRIVQALYRLGEAGAAEVADRIEHEAGIDSVRVTLRILEKKGHVTHRADGRRHVYSPVVPHQKASRSAIDGLVGTFFRGSPGRAALAMLGMSKLSDEELDELAELIDEKRKSHASDE